MNFGQIFQHIVDGQIVKRECWTTRKIKMGGGYPLDRFQLPAGPHAIAGQMLRHLLVTSGNSQVWGGDREDWEPYTIPNQDLFALDWMTIVEPVEEARAHVGGGEAMMYEAGVTIKIEPPRSFSLHEEEDAVPIVDRDFAAMYPWPILPDPQQNRIRHQTLTELMTQLAEQRRLQRQQRALQGPVVNPYLNRQR